ncbi:MAG: carbohydrate ABC transporter permease [Prochlorotrichaceae cyanobacterium]|jgi:alpha-glucoside transport system permease protein
MKTLFQHLIPKFFLHFTVIGLGILWTLPSLGLLISSLRPAAAIEASGWWSVLQRPLDFSQFTLENYAIVLGREGLFQAFLNSVVIALPATIITLTIAAFAAYALSWMQFPGRKGLFIAIVALLVVPLQMTLIPVLQLYNTLGLSGLFVGVWLAHTGYGMPLGVYLLRNSINALPGDLLEAAALDGATHWQTFTRIVLPLSIPALASFGIFQFLWVWNDLLVALVYLGANRTVAPLTLVLRNLVGDRGQDWHLLTAGAFVSMIIPLILFISLQRYFVRGLLAGSVKG